MSQGTVRLRTNRDVNELCVQKVHGEFMFCLKHFDAGLLRTGAACCERRRECMYKYMTD